VARLSTAVEKAHKVRGPEEAARHYADVDTELGLGNYTEEESEQGEEALSILEERFPGIRRRSVEKVETGSHMPNLSTRAKREMGEEHEGARRRAGSRTPSPKPSPRQRRATPSPRRATRSRPSRAIRRGWSSTGLPQTGLSVSQIAMRTIGGIAALSFLALLLSPRGSKAVSLTGSGLTHALEALVNPAVDPFRTGSLSKAAGVTLPGPVIPVPTLPVTPAPAEPYGGFTVKVTSPVTTTQTKAATP